MPLQFSKYDHSLFEINYLIIGKVNYKGIIQDIFLVTCDTMSENLQLQKN